MAGAGNYGENSWRGQAFISMRVTRHSANDSVAGVALRAARKYNIPGDSGKTRLSPVLSETVIHRGRQRRPLRYVTVVVAFEIFIAHVQNARTQFNVFRRLPCRAGPRPRTRPVPLLRCRPAYARYTPIRRMTSLRAAPVVQRTVRGVERQTESGFVPRHY